MGSLVATAKDEGHKGAKRVAVSVCHQEEAQEGYRITGVPILCLLSAGIADTSHQQFFSEVDF